MLHICSLLLCLEYPFSTESALLTLWMTYFHTCEPDGHMISKIWTAICEVEKAIPVRSCWMFAPSAHWSLLPSYQGVPGVLENVSLTKRQNDFMNMILSVCYKRFIVRAMFLFKKNKELFSLLFLACICSHEHYLQFNAEQHLLCRWLSNNEHIRLLFKIHNSQRNVPSHHHTCKTYTTMLTVALVLITSVI